MSSPFWHLLPALTGRSLPFPSPLDAVYFASYALSAAFLVSLLVRHNRHGSTARRAATIALLDERGGDRRPRGDAGRSPAPPSTVPPEIVPAEFSDR